MIEIQIKSKTTEGKEYTVTLAQDGFHCSCFSFICSKTTPKKCKHIPDAWYILDTKFRKSEQ